MTLITSELIRRVSGVSPPNELAIEDLALLDYVGPGRLLSFIDDPKFMSLARNNQSLCAVFTTQSIADDFKEYNSNVVTLIVDDPRWCFFSLYNEIARLNEEAGYASAVHATAIVAHSACIDEKNVTIGARTVIEPGVVILGRTVIGEKCVIRAGAIIGASGFEHKRTSKGILPVIHDRGVRIGNEVEIGGGSHIARSWGSRDTTIGDQTKLDALVHIAHGASVGSRCLIAAHAVICGSVIIGNDVWIGPSATISNGVRIGDSAFITIGSCVIKNVREGERVTGYFALPHEKFLIRNAK